MAGSQFEITILDGSGEKSHSRFQGVSIGAANFDAQVALQDTLETKLNAITLGTIHQRKRVASQVVISSTIPGVAAQREFKWLVVYHDDVTGKKYRMEIPCADTSLLLAGTDRMDTTQTEYTEFVDAFEAYVKQGEVVDNAVVVDYIQIVGRNL